MSDNDVIKQAMEQICDVLKELHGPERQGTRFCLFGNGAGRIDQGGETIESWGTIDELAELIRNKNHESKRDRVVKEAVTFVGGQVPIDELRRVVAAFLKTEPKDEESNDEPT